MEKVKAAHPPTDVPGSNLLFGVNKPMSRNEIMTGLPSKYTTDILVARYFNYHDPATREYYQAPMSAIMALTAFRYPA